MERYVFSREDAQREGLTHNPILLMMEAIHMLSTREYKDTDIEAVHVKRYHSEIFQHHKEGRRIFFTISPYDKEKNTSVPNHDTPQEFMGFKNVDGGWFLKMEDGEQTFYEPVEKIVDSSQIQNIREETIPPVT